MNSLGIDVSNYNKLVNWKIAKEHEVHFAGMRASISYAYRDPWITRNLSESHSLGIHPLPYHVLYPGEDPKTQATNFLAACGDVWFWAWPVIDMELDHGQTRERIRDTMLEWLQLVESGCGKRPLIYSRKYWIEENTLLGIKAHESENYWIDDFVVPGDWKTQYQWWLANYYDPATKEKPAPPSLPLGVTDWLIHQNSDLIPAWPGLNGEGGIVTCDIDRWNGDDSVVDRFFGEVVVPVPDIESRLNTLVSWANSVDEYLRGPWWKRYTGPKPE